MSPIRLGLTVTCWSAPPAAGEQGEPAFAQAAKRPLQRVAGAGIDIEFLPAGRLFTGMQMPMPAPSYPGSARAGRLRAAARYGAGSAWARAAVMSCTEPGARLGDPQREPVRRQHCLDVAAVHMGLAGVPGVDDLALHAESRLAAPVGPDDHAVQDDVRQPVLVRPLQRLMQVRGLSGERVEDLVPVPVGVASRCR